VAKARQLQETPTSFFVSVDSKGVKRACSVSVESKGLEVLLESTDRKRPRKC